MKKHTTLMLTFLLLSTMIPPSSLHAMPGKAYKAADGKKRGAEGGGESYRDRSRSREKDASKSTDRDRDRPRRDRYRDIDGLRDKSMTDPILTGKRSKEQHENAAQQGQSTSVSQEDDREAPEKKELARDVLQRMDSIDITKLPSESEFDASFFDDPELENEKIEDVDNYGDRGDVFSFEEIENEVREADIEARKVDTEVKEAIAEAEKAFKESADKAEKTAKIAIARAKINEGMKVKQKFIEALQKLATREQELAIKAEKEAQKGNTAFEEVLKTNQKLAEKKYIHTNDYRKYTFRSYIEELTEIELLDQQSD